MKNFFCVTLAVAAMSWVGTLHADEALRKVQQSLREQGFYYGPVDGAPGDETTQAVRRYQIRNGLPVTGQLDDTTKRTIQQTGAAASASGGGEEAPQGGQSGRNGGGASQRSTARPVATPANPESTVRRAAPEEDDAQEPGSTYQRPTVRPVPDETNRSAPRDVEDEDAALPPRGPGGGRPALRADPSEPEERTLPRNAVLPSERLSALFAGTPYEFAPPPVQADLLRRAQRTMTREGFYDGAVNGVPNSLTTDSLANFQGVNRLRKTGRLDVNTLALLRLLPGRQTMGPRQRGGDPTIIFEGRVR